MQTGKPYPQRFLILFRTDMAHLVFNAVLPFFVGCMCCSVYALNVTLRPKVASKYYLEGQNAEFTCEATPPAAEHNTYYVSWTLDGEEIPNWPIEVIKESKSINITSLHGGTSTLMCEVDHGIYSTNTSLNLLVLYKRPTSLTLEMNSEVVKVKVNVKIGHLYRFTCNVSDLNSANHITWLIEKGDQQTQIKDTCDWLLGNNTYRQASTEIFLNISEDHSTSRIVCRVVFPDNGEYEEVAVYLSTETPNLGTSTPEGATTFLSASKDPVSDVTRLPIMPTVVIIPVASSVVICVAIAIFFTRRRKYQQARTKEEVATSNEVSLTEVSAADEGAFGRSQRDYDFPRERIALHEVLGSGNFGHVYRATADGIYSPGIKVDVAVKILKKSADADVVADFEKEIAVQKDLMKHPNIVSMLGYCMETQPFYLILEYISGGNLQKFLRDKKDTWRDDPIEGAQPACPFQLLTFASEIANGMDYLSTMGCIHRDLATRNILLSDDLVCKLSDFGLARDVSETEQYERTSLGLIPVRWLALECLVENTYTTMSDVWSFGVLLWEIVTLGAHPYRGMSASQIIDSLVEGFRLPTPAHCNKQLYTVMKECWRISPTRRPSFSNLKRILDIMIPDSQIYLAMEDFVADKYT